MALSNHERIGKALAVLKGGLPEFVERKLRLVHGKNWWATIKQVTGPGMQRGGTEFSPEWDAGSVIKVPWKSWNDVFGVFGACGWQTGLARGTTHPPLTRPNLCRVDAMGYLGPRAPICHGAKGAFDGGLPAPSLGGLPVRPVVSRTEHRDRGSRAMVTGALLASCRGLRCLHTAATTTCPTAALAVTRVPPPAVCPSSKANHKVGVNRPRPRGRTEDCHGLGKDKDGGAES